MGCNTKMDLPETRQVLLAHTQQTKQMPNSVIITLQRHLLEVVGFEKEHGCRCLSNIQKDFPDDQEIHGRFSFWRRKAEMTCMQTMQAAGIQVVNMPQMPSNPFGDESSPEVQALREKAKKEIDAMSSTERGELIKKMTKKLEVLNKLPEDARLTHLKKIAEADKIEFIKVQILTMQMMQQQGANISGMQAPGETSGYPVSETVSTPVQQEMM